MHTLVRRTLLAGLTGALTVSAAWAGVGLAPVGGVDVPALPEVPSVAPLVPGDQPAAATTTRTSRGSVKAGGVLVGAAKNSIYPRPQDMRGRFPGARWERDLTKCRTLSPEVLARLPEAAEGALDGIASAGSPWPENPDCIYQGGFGLGPMNPVKEFDRTSEGGLNVRSVALRQGGKVLVLSVLDAEGWLWDYRSKCTDCGAKQISAALAADPQLKAAGFTADSYVLHATHSHASPDFIGGWGFVPDWYMAQVTDTIKKTVKQAVLAARPARLTAGEVEARQQNAERRDTYRSAEEQQLGWLRAVGTDGEVIAQVGAYAAHPTTKGTNDGVASADWPGLFAKTLEARDGGVAMHVMTGLGNVLASGGTEIGTQLAAKVPTSGGQVVDGALRLQRTTFRSALTNVPLDALGTPGFFDRKFDPQPAVVSVGENPDAPCTSASPQSVELPLTVAQLGDWVLTTGPGEEFSNLSNTIKEKNPGKVVFPVSQANDALGYMPQSFELDPVGQQGLGFAFSGYVFVNYEDSYAVDRCVGDLALETTLSALTALRKG